MVLHGELQYLHKFSEYLASKVAQEGSRHADVDVVWTALKDYMSQHGKRAATALVARACQAGRFETTSKAEVKAMDTFNCNLCQKVYKKIGFLKRHLSTVHKVSETAPTPGQTSREVPTVPASGIALSSEQVRANIDLNQGLRCLICGKGANKGKSWGEKTLTNHMAAEHKVNSRTG